MRMVIAIFTSNVHIKYLFFNAHHCFVRTDSAVCYISLSMENG